MAVGDCEGCWQNPCKCGAKYKTFSDEKLKEIATVVFLECLRREEENPNRDCLPDEMREVLTGLQDFALSKGT